MVTLVVLAVGQDSTLLNSRSMLLQSAGYIVHAVSSTPDAIHQFIASDFDIVLLCHSVPPEEREYLTRLIRLYGSDVPVLCIAPFGEFLVDGAIGNSPSELLHGIEKAIYDDAMSHSLPFPSLAR